MLHAGSRSEDSSQGQRRSAHVRIAALLSLRAEESFIQTATMKNSLVSLSESRSWVASRTHLLPDDHKAQGLALSKEIEVLANVRQLTFSERAAGRN